MKTMTRRRILPARPLDQTGRFPPKRHQPLWDLFLSPLVRIRSRRRQKQSGHSPHDIEHTGHGPIYPCHSQYDTLLCSSPRFVFFPRRVYSRIYLDRWSCSPTYPMCISSLDCALCILNRRLFSFMTLILVRLSVPPHPYPPVTLDRQYGHGKRN